MGLINYNDPKITILTPGMGANIDCDSTNLFQFAIMGSAFYKAVRNCKNPMLSSLQGTDAQGQGTFSSETGGMIKAYNNKIRITTNVKLVFLIIINPQLKNNMSLFFDCYIISFF